MAIFCAWSCIASNLEHLFNRGAEQVFDVCKHLVLILVSVSCYQDQPVGCSVGSACRLELWQPVFHIIRDCRDVSLHSPIEDTISDLVTTGSIEAELCSKVSLKFSD
jgi:hypothetical protein